MNYYPGGYMNPYYTQQPNNQMRMQPTEQPYNSFPQTPQIFKQSGLQGKSVDSVEVVKAMDIPLDGSISYFPLTDGTAIVTKQLQQDGTSRTIIYKPIEGEESAKLPKYITSEELESALKNINTNEWKDEIKTLKRQIKDLNSDLKEISEELNK